MGRVFVTGASGFIGGHVARRLASEGWAVRTIVRSPGAVAALERDGVECLVGDLLDVMGTDRAVAECQAIVHCAAKVGDFGPPSDYLHVNVGGLKNLLAAAARVPDLDRFILMSSLGVYSPRDHFGTAEAEPMADNPLDGYTLSKIESERVLADWLLSRRSVQGFALRPGFVYGPGDRTVTPKLVQALRNGKFAFFGSGDAKMNVIFIEHLVNAVRSALTVKSAGPQCGSELKAYNLTDEIAPTRNEFIAAFCRELQVSVPKIHIPIPIAKLLCWASETVAKLVGAQSGPALSLAKFKFLALNLEFSIERARRELDYKPSFDLDSAVRQTIAWVKGHESHTDSTSKASGQGRIVKIAS